MMTDCTMNLTCYLLTPSMLHWNSSILKTLYPLYNLKGFIHVLHWVCARQNWTITILSTYLDNSIEPLPLKGFFFFFLNGMIIAQFIIELETYIDFLSVHLSFTVPKPKAPSRQSAVPHWQSSSWHVSNLRQNWEVKLLGSLLYLNFFQEYLVEQACKKKKKN